MIYVAGENLVPILVALLIGFVTGLWIWKFARRRGEGVERVLTEDAEMRRPYVDNRPLPPSPTTLPPAARPATNRPIVRVSEAFGASGPRPEPEVLARRTASPGATPAASGPTDDVGDNDVASGAAAAVEDIADQFLGIDAHPSPSGNPGGPAAATDDLQLMKGVGPKLAALLHAEGITRFSQIAELTPDDLARLDAHLGAFKGRLVRDRIVQQAAYLSAGDRAGYEREFGRL